MICEEIHFGLIYFLLFYMEYMEYGAHWRYIDMKEIIQI